MVLTAGAGTAITLFRCSQISGDPVIFPTDTIYGIGAPLVCLKANEKIFDIKQRPAGQPLPVLVSDYDQLWELAEKVPQEAQDWLNAHWPGHYTVIFKSRPEVPSLYTKGGTVGVRLLPAGWLADAVRITGPVTATSVNPSGASALNRPDKIIEMYGDVVPYVLYGEPPGAKASSIVSLTGGIPVMIRH